MKKFIIFFVLIVFAVLAGGIFGKAVKKEDEKLVNAIATIAASVTPGAGGYPALPFSKPTALSVPKLGITAAVEYVGMDAKGNMDVPKSDENVAWFQPGFLPGVKGNAVLAGHYDKKDGGPAIFYNLNKLEKGDEIIITDVKEKELTFVVTDKNNYPVNNFPIPTVFGPSGKKYLNLVTCGGVWDPVQKIYADRLVVRTELVEGERVKR